ncbi:aminotransferase class I/II-fold pyridoxal phosphate-dependent enzyme, partial [Candidatus Margulisiibacteriota bacterium]
MKNKYSEVLENIPPSGIRKFFDLVIGNDDIISLGIGEPDFITPWNIREEAMYSLEKGYTSYTSNQGLEALREQIALYVKNRFKAKYDPIKEILITVGVSEAADITFRALINPGDEVILPEPCYVCYAPLIKLAGGTVVPLDTSKSNFLVDPAHLKKKITKKTKMIILCSPNNPTGSVIPKENLQAIANLAEKHDLWVMSDEIYSELIYGQDYTSFAALKNMKKRTILMNGFSKAFAMTGWRIAYICAPEDILSRVLKIHQYSILCAPIMAQYAAIEALKNSLYEVEEMRKSYLHRRNMFIKGLNEIGLPTEIPGGAFYCFPNIKHTGLSSEEFALQLIKKEKVAVVPGNVFGIGGEGHVRCC